MLHRNPASHTIPAIQYYIAQLHMYIDIQKIMHVCMNGVDECWLVSYYGSSFTTGWELRSQYHNILNALASQCMTACGTCVNTRVESVTVMCQCICYYTVIHCAHLKFTHHYTKHILCNRLVWLTYILYTGKHLLGKAFMF